MKRLTSRAIFPSALHSGRLSLYLLAFVVPFGLNSCIYDSYGDEFYRTLWVAEKLACEDMSKGFGDGMGDAMDDRMGDAMDDRMGRGVGKGSEDGLGEAMKDNMECGVGRVSAGKVTLEFLCGGSVSIRADGAIGSYGTYKSVGASAEFKNLTLTYGTGSATTVIIIEEATRNGNKLQLNWHNSKSRAAQFTAMRRLSAYE